MFNQPTKIMSSVGNNLENKEEDVKTIRNNLRKINFIESESDDDEKDYQGNTLGILTKRLDTKIKSFQHDNDLKEDGRIYPNGETENKIHTHLQKDNKDKGNAYLDFWDNYWDMRKANTLKSDKYFHCKANYEASKRGKKGEKTAKTLSDLREWTDHYISGDSQKDNSEDQQANKYGRNAAISGKFKSAKEACTIYRPNGLDEKY